MINVNIQIVNPKDWKLYRDIRLESLKEEPTAYGSKYEDYKVKDDAYWINYLKNPENVVFIAQLKGNSVGIVRVTLSDPDIPNVYAYLGSLYVKPENRRLGIAQSLVKYAEEYVKRETSKEGLILEVYEHLGAAVELYQQLGYKVQQRKTSDGINDILMVKTFLS